MTTRTGPSPTATETGPEWGSHARVSAVFAALALTGLTAQLLVPDLPRPTGARELALAYADPRYLLEGRIVLFQVFFMFLALWGAVRLRLARAPGAAWAAAGLLLLWQALELVPRSVDLVAAVPWAEEALAGAPPESLERLVAWSRVEGALGAVRRLVWGGTHLALFLAFLRAPGLGPWLAALFLFNAVRLLPRSVAALWGAELLPGVLSGPLWFFAGTMPLFLLLAVWLWRQPAERPAPRG